MLPIGHLITCEYSSNDADDADDADDAAYMPKDCSVRRLQQCLHVVTQRLISV
jgi:hypothetical protein